MIDFILNTLQHPFTWGLLAGLTVALLQIKKIWELKTRIKYLESHLIKGHEASLLTHERLQKELESLRAANLNFRDKLAQLSHSPRGQITTQLDAFQRAVAKMTREAPGFAQAFADALERSHAEIFSEIDGARRPSLGFLGGLPIFQPKTTLQHVAPEPAAPVSVVTNKQHPITGS